jgi:hypothetical protein
LAGESRAWQFVALTDEEAKQIEEIYRDVCE